MFLLQNQQKTCPLWRCTCTSSLSTTLARYDACEICLLIVISTEYVYKSGEVVNHVTQELGGKVTRQARPIPGINTKIVAFLDPDGWKTVSPQLNLVLYLHKTKSGQIAQHALWNLRPQGLMSAWNGQMCLEFGHENLYFLLFSKLKIVITIVKELTYMVNA